MGQGVPVGALERGHRVESAISAIVTVTVASSPVPAVTSAATSRCTAWASSRQLWPSR